MKKKNHKWKILHVKIDTYPLFTDDLVYPGHSNFTISRLPDRTFDVSAIEKILSQNEKAIAEDCPFLFDDEIEEWIRLKDKIENDNLGKCQDCST